MAQNVAEVIKQTSTRFPTGVLRVRGKTRRLSMDTGSMEAGSEIVG